MHDRLALMAIRFGKSASAREILEPAIESQRRIASANWSDRALSAQLESRLGRVLMLEGRLQAAMDVLTSRTLQLRQVVAERPAVLALRSDLTSLEQHLARTYADAGRIGEALEALDRADALIRELRSAAPDDPRHDVAYSNALRLRAELLLDFGRQAEAVPLLEQALEVPSSDTETTDARSAALVSARSLMARIVVRMDNLTRARVLINLAAGGLLPDGESDASRTSRNLRYWHAEAVVRTAEGDHARAAEAWQRIVHAAAPRDGYEESVCDSGLRGVALFHLGRMEEARAVREQLTRTEVRVAENYTLLPE